MLVRAVRRRFLDKLTVQSLPGEYIKRFACRPSDLPPGQREEQADALQRIRAARTQPGDVHHILQELGGLRVDMSRSCESLQQLARCRVAAPLPYERLTAYIFLLQLLRRKCAEFHEELAAEQPADSARREMLAFALAALHQLGALCAQDRSLAVLKARRLTSACMRLVWRLRGLLERAEAIEALVSLSRTGEESAEHFHKLLHVLGPALPELGPPEVRLLLTHLTCSSLAYFRRRRKDRRVMSVEDSSTLEEFEAAVTFLVISYAQAIDAVALGEINTVLRNLRGTRLVLGAHFIRAIGRRVRDFSLGDQPLADVLTFFHHFSHFEKRCGSATHRDEHIDAIYQRVEALIRAGDAQLSNFRRGKLLFSFCNCYYYPSFFSAFVEKVLREARSAANQAEFARLREAIGATVERLAAAEARLRAGAGDGAARLTAGEMAGRKQEELALDDLRRQLDGLTAQSSKSINSLKFVTELLISTGRFAGAIKAKRPTAMLHKTWLGCLAHWTATPALAAHTALHFGLLNLVCAMRCA